MGSSVSRVIGWRSSLRAVTEERLLIHNVVVGAGTMVAGGMGVAFQSLVSHQLKPADYGAVFAVVTLITFIGLPASALTVLMAREASRDLAVGGSRTSATLLRRGNRALLLLGLAIAAAIAISSPVLSDYLGTSSSLILAATVGIPFGIALPLLLGEFQGDQRFGTFAALAAGQATLKLVAAIALGMVLGPVGVIAGISVAGIATYVAAMFMLRSKGNGRRDADWWRPAISYLAIVLPSTLALSVLLSSDVVLVKHYFGARDAGEYSAVAAIGRAIFWGASGVAAVLLPKVVFRSSRGERSSRVVISSLLLVALGGLVSFGLLSVGSEWLLTAFAGHAYAAGASLLPWYAIGMTLLGATAVLIATHQSLGRPGFLAILLPLALLEPVLIAAFHETLIQVVQVVDLSFGLVLAGLTAVWVAQQPTTQPARILHSVAPVSAEP